MLTQVKTAWNTFWFEPVSPAPICLFRILVGLLTLVDSLLWYPDLLLWSGRHGVIPNDAMQNFPTGVCIFVLHDFSDQQMYALFAVQLLACLFLIVGFFSRTSAFVVWLFFCSLAFREVVFWHQVGLFLRLYSFLLIFAPAGAMYSVDAWTKKRRGQSTELKLYAPLAQRLLQFQVACVYFRASIGKFLGNEWREGRAVYYVLHHKTTVRHLVPAFLDHMWFYNLTTYYTLVIESCMWTLIWVPPINKFVLLGALFLHSGIEWFINLDLLEWAIVCSYVLFLPPVDIESFMLKIRNLLSWRFKR
ncbi:MAG: HTTM domain-containing protein [Candidatus Obscuribacterales bacterium]|nr:HTTM domain-containing protein [Candidatus Obscuribacterales bacterium]